jgi:ketol-acid reductoisomerase
MPDRLRSGQPLNHSFTKGKTLYFSHGFGITFKEQTGIIPSSDVDVILAAPKGSGTSVRRLFLQGKGINASFAVFQMPPVRLKPKKQLL